MTTIREIAGDGSWTRAHRALDEGEAVPRGWTDAPLPEGVGPSDLVLWTGGAWVIATEAQRAGYARGKVAPLVEEKLAALADQRWRRQEAGVVVGGFPIKTDPESRSTITAAYFLAKGDPTMVRRWKVAPGVFVDLDADLMIAIGDAVLAYIQACFDRESDLTDEILAAAAAGDMQALAQIDITAEWP